MFVVLCRPLGTLSAVVPSLREWGRANMCRIGSLGEFREKKVS
jgi:hypothetical protein